MSAAHTPGPWVVDVCNNVWHSGDTKIAALSEQPHQAEIYRTQSEEERKANARLIAAAPDLLEALEAAVDCGIVPKSTALEGGASSHVRAAKVADQIRAAIAKARGTVPTLDKGDM